MYRFLFLASLTLILVLPTAVEACHGGPGKHPRPHWKPHGGPGRCGKGPMSLPPKNLCTIPNQQYHSQLFDIDGEAHKLSITVNNTVPVIQLTRIADSSRAIEERHYSAMPVVIPPSWFDQLHRKMGPLTRIESREMTLFRPAAEPERVCKKNLIFFKWEEGDKVSVPAYFSGFVGFELRDNGVMDGIAQFSTGSYTTVMREYVLKPASQ